MKKTLSILLSVLLVLTVLPTGALYTPVVAEGEAESVVLNVKDFGAVGDGKTDDEAAIWATFESALMNYMIKDIPVTVYFPEGQYGLKRGGLYVYLPRGAGNLTIKGDGADKSTIVYLEEWTNGGSWVALRIYPKITPESIDQYLHDITIQDLGIYDTDPVKHAWNTANGDPGTEETHGFNIQHCVRATIKSCKIDSVGDEAIDMSHCIDSVMRDNLVINSPGAGSAGGAISVGDGSKNVLITNNSVIGSIDNPNKTNWAIAVEALTEHVEDVTIANNQIQGIAGWGINLGAPNGTMADVVIRNNTICDCRDGGIRLHGKGTTTNTQIYDNAIDQTRYGILLDGSSKVGTLIENCTIENLSDYAVNVSTPSHRDTIVRNTVIRNAQRCALYNGGTNTLFDRLLVDGSGTAGDVADSAVIQYAKGGDCTISNSVFLNCRNKCGIQDIAKVINTYVQQPELSGYMAITGATLIQNCWVNRMITLKSGCIVDGLTMTATEDLGTHAIALSNLTDCTVTNCRITIPSHYGISETGTADRNTITNNVIVGGSGIKTVGVDTVAEGNVCSALAINERFRYYLVDGAAAIIDPVDATLSAYTIPDTIEGCPVTTIDPWAFALNASLTDIVLPHTVTTIGQHVFNGCINLANVYYTGSADEWSAITIGNGNESFYTAQLTVNYVSNTFGDINNDGKINNKDLGLLQQYLNGREVIVNEKAADVNGDGKTNNKDLGLLQRYLNGWDVNLG